MEQVSAADLSRSFINATKREAAQMRIPFDLEQVDWEATDFLGWTDPKAPQRAYLFVPLPDRLCGMILRATPPRKNKAMCNWCADVTEVSDVRMFTARLAGPAGRAGNTVGTLLHSDFGCSQYVRRRPSRFEGQHDPEGFITERILSLQINAETFTQKVLKG